MSHRPESISDLRRMAWIRPMRHGTGHMYLSWNVQPVQNELIIHGTRGVMHVDCYLQICTVRKRLPGPRMVQRIVAAATNSASTFLKNFGQRGAIRHRKAAAVTGDWCVGDEVLRGAAPGSRAAGFRGRGPAHCCLGRAPTRGASADNERCWEQAAAAPPPARNAVTGRAGSWARLGRTAAQQCESIRVLARRPVAGLEGNPRVLSSTRPGRTEAVERAVEGVELVYHVGAGMRGGAEAFESGTVWGTKNVVAACLRHGIRRLVYVSSLSVLDQAPPQKAFPSRILSYRAAPELRGAYSRTKLIAENVVLDAVRNQNLPAVILRPGQIFGPGAEKTPPSGVIGLAGRWL